MADNRFICVICGSEFARETVADECEVCHQCECNECIGEGGACVPCKE